MTLLMTALFEKFCFCFYFFAVKKKQFNVENNASQKVSVLLQRKTFNGQFPNKILEIVKFLRANFGNFKFRLIRLFA